MRELLAEFLEGTAQLLACMLSVNASEVPRGGE